jgi:hypothetical protein
MLKLLNYSVPFFLKGRFLTLSVGVEKRYLTEIVSLTENMAEEAGVDFISYLIVIYILVNISSMIMLHRVLH